MYRKTTFRLGTTLCLSLLVSAVGVRPSSAAADPRWGADYFPDVSLVTQDGKTVHFYSDLLKDKIVVIDLIYTHPMKEDVKKKHFPHSSPADPVQRLASRPVSFLERILGFAVGIAAHFSLNGSM